jgi:hypothetical protein
MAASKVPLRSINHLSLMKRSGRITQSPLYRNSLPGLDFLTSGAQKTRSRDDVRHRTDIEINFPDARDCL